MYTYRYWLFSGFSRLVCVTFDPLTNLGVVKIGKEITGIFM
jgi:hypothetical protein